MRQAKCVENHPAKSVHRRRVRPLLKPLTTSISTGIFSSISSFLRSANISGKPSLLSVKVSRNIKNIRNGSFFSSSLDQDGEARTAECTDSLEREGTPLYS